MKQEDKEDIELLVRSLRVKGQHLELNGDQSEATILWDCVDYIENNIEY